MTDLENPSEIFTSQNKQLAELLKGLVHKAVTKASEAIEESENINDMLTAIKVAETAGKITGIVQEKQAINLQINQISGFTFVEIDKEKPKELTNDDYEIEGEIV